MSIQYIELGLNEGEGLQRIKFFNSFEEFNEFFHNFCIDNKWKGFFSRYLKCFEHIFKKNDYSDLNILRLELLFTGKNEFEKHCNRHYVSDNSDNSDTDSDYFTEDDYDNDAVDSQDVYVEINDKYIYIKEQDDGIKFYNLSGHIFIVENHPLQIMFKKLKESTIDKSPVDRVIFGNKDSLYYVNEFDISETPSSL